MENSKKALCTTLGLTLTLFAFIMGLLYVIYCYAYYDKYQEQIYIDNFNNNKYSFVYKKLIGKGKLTYEEFNSSIDLMTNKESLLSIYNYFYSNSDLYTEESFLKTHLFKTITASEKNISFSSNGKTNLLNRKAIFYDEINIKNDTISTTIGVINKVTLNLEDNSTVRIDNKQIDCIDNVCTIDKIYGGLHELTYISNGYEYYALININKDKQSINVATLDNLVKIEKQNQSLNYGKYIISKCNLTNIEECPSMSKSYLILNEDNTYILYMYYTKDNKGIITNGTFSYEENLLNLVSTRYNYQSYVLDGINLISNNLDYDYIYVGK